MEIDLSEFYDEDELVGLTKNEIHVRLLVFFLIFNTRSMQSKVSKATRIRIGFVVFNNILVFSIYEIKAV